MPAKAKSKKEENKETVKTKTAQGKKTTKKAAITKAYEKGQLDVSKIRQRRKFKAIKDISREYYENPEDKKLSIGEMPASRSYTELAVGTKAKTKDKYKHVLTVKIRSVGQSAAHGPYAIAEYVSPSAPDDEPCYVMIPYNRFATYSDKELRDRKIASKYEFIKKRVGAITSIVPVLEPVDIDGATFFVGDRLLAMEIEKNNWFTHIEGKDGTDLGYKYEVGEKAQARIQAVTSASLWVELMGVECNIPAQEIKNNYCNPAELYTPGDIVWVKITDIIRDESNWKAIVSLSIKQTKENANDILFNIIKKDQIWDGVVTYVNNPKGYMLVDVGNDSRIWCHLVPGARRGDKVKVHMHEPWIGNDGEKKLSGYAEYLW